MFMPLSLRCCTTQSIAAMTWETSVAPPWSATLTLRILASGATPTKLSSSDLLVTVVTAASLPAMMPAMAVPWPKVSM